MNWELAVEKNLEALKRILAMLVAMAGISAGSAAGTSPSTLPRHLHRFVLSLLRPAESATRRLIIVAARGLVVKLPKRRAEKNEQRASRPGPRARPEPGRDTASGDEPVPAPAPRVPFFPMFDPMKRFDRKPARKRIPDARMPRIALLNDDGRSVPIHLRRPAPPPPPPPPTPDDPLDAASIHRRLDMIGRALDDLPRQAQRFARWKARQNARRALEREGEAERSPSGKRREAEGVNWEDLGVTPEALALIRRRRDGSGQPSTLSRAKPRRFTRIELLRPGRPPGWRKRPTHEIHDILNDLHGLAVWARDGP
jgi:hypothetical protein